MTLEFYKALHLFGIIILFAGIGGFIAVSNGGPLKFAAILHGLGLVVILVSGFGMQAKINKLMDGELGWPWWLILKVVLWLVLGAMLALAKRRVVPVKTAILISIIIGLVLAYLGLTWRTGFRV